MSRCPFLLISCALFVHGAFSFAPARLVQQLVRAFDFSISGVA